MASNNEYKLTIEVVGGEGENPGTTTPTAENGGAEQKSAKKDQGNSVIKGAMVYHVAKNVAQKYASQTANTITLRTGYEELQARFQAAYNIGTRIFNIGESIVAGTIMSGGNPVGTLIGLGVGMLNEAIDVGMATRQVQIARDVESTQRYLTSIRMGAGANRGGRE